MGWLPEVEGLLRAPAVLKNEIIHSCKMIHCVVTEQLYLNRYFLCGRFASGRKHRRVRKIRTAGWHTSYPFREQCNNQVAVVVHPSPNEYLLCHGAQGNSAAGPQIMPPPKLYHVIMRRSPRCEVTCSADAINGVCIMICTILFSCPTRLIIYFIILKTNKYSTSMC